MSTGVAIERTEAVQAGGFVIGQPTQYVLGLMGEVTAKDDGTITIGGITVPTRLTPDGPVRYLSTVWPSDPADIPGADRSECVPEDDYNDAERQVTRLCRGVEVLHDEHHQGVFRTCLHEVCRGVQR